MKYFPLLRSLAMALCGVATGPLCLASGNALPAAVGPDFMLFSGQGYLGVDLGEVDSQRAATLHLKDTRGAEVTMIDHDAPAGKSGLKVHDVILQLDGKPFDTVEQLRHRLLEMPSGRSVSLLVSRDGNRISMTVQLCDRSKLQQQAWQTHFKVPDPARPATRMPANSFMPSTQTGAPAFLVHVLPKTLYVGASVNPIPTQLADYFGVTSGTGLLVENVDAQSPAALAGMKAGDVIVQVQSQPMKSRNDWVKAIHKHRGEQLQVTVMRNKQEQILTLTAGKPRKS